MGVVVAGVIGLSIMLVPQTARADTHAVAFPNAGLTQGSDCWIDHHSNIAVSDGTPEVRRRDLW